MKIITWPILWFLVIFKKRKYNYVRTKNLFVLINFNYIQKELKLSKIKI